MSLSPRLSDVAVNVKANAFAALFDGGFLDIYDGTQPATADTAITTQVLLASLGFGSPAFGAAVAGVATAHAITSDADANASGTPTWYRCFKADHTTVIQDGSVAAFGANLGLGPITIHTPVTVDSFVLTESKS